MHDPSQILNLGFSKPPMILAIDTATRWTGLALYDGTAVTAEHGWHGINNQTVELAPAIEKILARGKLDVGDLRAVAVAIGPGSYTGLRVGLAVAKGMSLAYQIPLIGVPTLDIVAAGFGKLNGRLLVAVEAGRTRVSVALFDWKRGKWVGKRPFNDSWENILANLEGDITFTGEIAPAAAKQIRAASPNFHLAPAANGVRRAGYLASIGWKRLKAKKSDDAAALAPDYLRKIE